MSEQQEREAFEAWMSDGGKWPKAIERDHVGGYRLVATASAWRVWQAARSQQQQQAAEALRAARDCILLDRTALADTHMNPATNTVDEDGQAGLNEYDAVLAKIDAALSELTGGGNG